MPKTSHELRCFCNRRPLLAVYGVDEKRKLYVHVRIYKQRRLYGEVLVTEGKVEIHCRECFRWHKITIIKPGIAKLEETEAPAMVRNV